MSSRVEELDDDGNVVGAFDEAAWLNPLSADWVYVEGDPLPTTEPSILDPVKAALGSAYGAVTDYGAGAVLYGWVPFVLWTGMNTEPRPEGCWLSLLLLRRQWRGGGGGSGGGGGGGRTRNGQTAVNAIAPPPARMRGGSAWMGLAPEAAPVGSCCTANGFLSPGIRLQDGQEQQMAAPRRGQPMARETDK